MSINQFSTELPETLWWAQNHHHHHHQSLMEPNQNPSTHKPLITNPNSSSSSSSWPTHLYYQQHHSYLNPYNNNTHQPHQMFSSTQNTSLSFNLNHQEIENDDQEPLDEQNQEREEHIEKEPMFEKPLTPSDVGKLNRLVIPKQHAEKYFPLGGDSVEKGLLLSFEDELGKFWRFRYSYWNSSQSYVLTKGWSRYVKEKQLDAGDVVLFERHRVDGERLFIGWRRRGESGSGVMVHGNSGGVWSRGLLYSQQRQQPYQVGHGANVSTRVPYQPDCLHAGSSGDNQAIPIVGNSKRLRLFGVNLECQLEDSSSTEPSTPDGSSMSSQQGPHHLHQFHSSYYSSNTSSQSHMEITFSRDVNEMRNRRG